MFKNNALNAKYEIVRDATVTLPGSLTQLKVSEINDADTIEAMISRKSGLVKRKEAAAASPGSAKNTPAAGSSSASAQ